MNRLADHMAAQIIRFLCSRDLVLWFKCVVQSSDVLHTVRRLLLLGHSTEITGSHINLRVPLG